MPMPKGTKIGKYATLRGRESKSFREIARIMTKRGDRMRHATARGVLLSGLEKLAKPILIATKGYCDPVDVKRLVKDEAFQIYIGEVLDAIERQN